MNTSGPEYIHDLFTINVQRYAAFCKNIPEYCQLGEEDQIALFKGCITEASLLRSAQSYAEHPGEFRIIGSSEERLSKLACKCLESLVFSASQGHDKLGNEVAIKLHSRKENNVNTII